MANRRSLLIQALSLLLVPVTASAIVTDQGGQKFKGAGDKEPPRCTFNVPSSASSSFFVSWDCKDNFERETPRSNIRTALWIRRDGDSRWHKIDDFLGFPASVQVDESLLRIGPDQSFSEGLPVSFRLEAYDTAGIATISTTRTVLGDDDTLNSCDLVMSTSPTESTGSTTGVPSMTVVVNDGTISSSQTLVESIEITSPAAISASPCEIDSVCANDNTVLLTATVTLDADGTASGPVSITPGAPTFEATGTYISTQTGQVIDMTLKGTTDIAGNETTVSISCQNK